MTGGQLEHRVKIIARENARVCSEYLSMYHLSLALASLPLSIYLSRARALSLYHIRVIRPVVFLPYEEDLCPDANEYSMLTATMAREQKF